MNFSYDTDSSAQASQFRPDTFQHGFTRFHQSPTWASSNFVPSPFVLDWLRSLPAQLQQTSRPLSYSVFIERTKHQWQCLKDDSRPLKSWLRLAESIRRCAESFDKQADLESAFVEYAKAATVLLEKIPEHPDYWVLLSTDQRHDMGQRGQETLDCLAEIKFSIMTRYEQWRDPSSVQPQATTSSTPSSLRTCANVNQRPTEDDRAPGERLRRLDALLREDPRRHEDVYPTDGTRENRTHLRRMREQGVRLWVAGQRRLEQDGTLRRQRMADATQPAGLGQLTGQDQGVTGPIMPVSSLTDAFHPYPDRPIYTDADNGHDQISGLPSEIVDLREHITSESRDSVIALPSAAGPSRRRTVALPSENTPEVIRGSLSGYQAGHDGEGEEEEVAHAPRTVGGHDEPISEPETPRQRPAVLHPTKSPAHRSNVSHKYTPPSVNHSDGVPLRTITSMQSEAAANPTPEVFEGLDTLHRPPKSQLRYQQPEYLRILQDKFGTSRPDRGHGYSFTDYNSSRNEVDGNYQESFVDPDNESSNGRCSVKTVSKGSFFTRSILSPARSQLTSIFD